MPPSYAEWKQRSGESVGSIHTPSVETALGMIKTAAVSFEHLTNDSNWDRYLSHLQAIYETAKVERDRWKTLLTSLFSESSLREAQCMFHHYNAQVLLLEQIMLLPSQLKAEYESLKGGQSV